MQQELSEQDLALLKEARSKYYKNVVVITIFTTSLAGLYGRYRKFPFLHQTTLITFGFITGTQFGGYFGRKAAQKVILKSDLLERLKTSTESKKLRQNDSENSPPLRHKKVNKWGDVIEEESS